MENPAFKCALLMLLILYASACTPQQSDRDDGKPDLSARINNGTSTYGVIGPNQSTLRLDDLSAGTLPKTPVKTPAEKITYTPSRAYSTFTDPNENAFTVSVPKGWVVTSGSGLVRPYIDAGVYLQMKSPQDQEIFYASPHGPIYATPNQLLTMAGFTEGSQYNPSGGIAKPMIVMRYLTAREYLSALPKSAGLSGKIAEITERDDLLKPAPLVTQQSAAEMTFVEDNGKKHKAIAITQLVEISGTGVWLATVSDYSAPSALFDETEFQAYMVRESFRVDPEWAKREQQEITKRIGIISGAQNEISDMIRSSFEMRSKSMDDHLDKWSKTMLGTEDVYNTDTGDRYTVDSGSRYYWTDGKDIFGTDIDVNPDPYGTFRKMDCPGCEGR